MSLCSYTLSKTKIPSFTLSGCKARYLLCILLIFSNYAERQGFEPITLTAYMSATLLSKFQIGNETVTIFNR